MQRRLLDELVAARGARRQAVVVTELAAAGRQTLLYPDDEAAPADVAPALWAAAQQALARDDSGTVEVDGASLFLHVHAVPLRLIVVGAVHIAQALAPMAALVGWDLVIVDPRRAWATTARFPGVALRHEWPDAALAALAPDRRTAVVTLTHDPKLDDPALVAALRSPTFFVGALGSRKTHASRLGRLREAGFSDGELARIRGPVGLAIGARSTAEIAVSIVAQVVAALRGGAAGEGGGA